MKRVIIYTNLDGSETQFDIANEEEEQHERSHAMREISSKDTLTVGFRFAWVEDEDEAEATN